MKPLGESTPVHPQTGRPHVHFEAFCLMTYETADGAIMERIWNSRDGVTPFCIRTVDGSEEMQHVRWREDTYAPNHRPEPGDRVFCDMTEPRARALIAEAQAKRGFDDEAAAAILKSLTREGAPTLVVVVDPDNFVRPR